MYIKTYKVLYAKTGEVFTRPFMDYADPAEPVEQPVTLLKGLERVNEWNRYNATSGFTYWID